MKLWNINVLDFKPTALVWSQRISQPPQFRVRDVCVVFRIGVVYSPSWAELSWAEQVSRRRCDLTQYEWRRVKNDFVEPGGGNGRDDSVGVGGWVGGWVAPIIPFMASSGPSQLRPTDASKLVGPICRHAPPLLFNGAPRESRTKSRPNYLISRR